MKRGQAYRAQHHLATPKQTRGIRQRAHGYQRDAAQLCFPYPELQSAERLGRHCDTTLMV